MCDSFELFGGLLHAREGHFTFESGHHGSFWLDLELLFERPQALEPLIRELGSRLLHHKPEAVCGPLNGGALVAFAIARDLGLSFFFTESASDGGATNYCLPASLQSRVASKRIAVVDDVINAGSAVRSTLNTLSSHGAHCVAIGALAILGHLPQALAEDLALPLEALTVIPNTLWHPSSCPLCEKDIPLDRSVSLAEQ